MKDGGPRHPKIYHLARVLKVPRAHAVGIVECLHCEAREYAPAGDIGKFPDEQIAEWCAWTESAKTLVDALVDAKLVEKHRKFRLIVHDWYDHATEYVHRTLAKSRMRFCTGEAPSTRSLNSEERKEADAFYTQTAATNGTRQRHGENVAPPQNRRGSQSSSKPQQQPAPEPAPDPEPEQAPEPSPAPEPAPAREPRGAKAAAGVIDATGVRLLLLRLFANDRAASELAVHPNATPDRVTWLYDRIQRGDATDNAQGFMRKGIEQAWDVPPKWIKERRVAQIQQSIGHTDAACAGKAPPKRGQVAEATP